MRYEKICVVAALSLTILSGCVHESLAPEIVGPGQENPGGEPAGEACDESIAYYNEVQDILLTNCAMSGCHDAQTAQEGIILTSYENVMSSDIVEPNDPGDSDLYEVLVEDDEEDRMPRGRDPLSQEQIALIAEWIGQGAKNVTCNAMVCVTENVSFTSHIQPLLDQKCGSCHRGASPSGNVNLSSHAGVKTVADNGKLIGVVSHAAGFTPMPFGGQKLADCQVEMIRSWVEGGALNN